MIVVDNKKEKMMFNPPPPPPQQQIECLYILEPHCEIQFEIADRQNVANPDERKEDQNIPEKQTYGAMVSISGMTSGSTFVIVAITADAPDGVPDLTTLDGDVLYPYTPEALPSNTVIHDYPKYSQKINGSQDVKVRVKRNDRR